MGWFDEQIRQRKLSDQEIFEDSIFRMASVVLGRREAGALKDARIVTKAAIDEILKYYHCKSIEKKPPQVPTADFGEKSCPRIFRHPWDKTERARRRRFSRQPKLMLQPLPVTPRSTLAYFLPLLKAMMDLRQCTVCL